MGATIPQWPINCTNAESCYRGCTGIDSAWSSEEADLMPARIVTHGNCVTGASAELRSLFAPDWGGTREGLNVPLTFTANQAGSTVAMVSYASAPSVTLEYSTDGGENWNPFVVGTTTVTLANVGDKVSIRAGSSGNSAFGSQTGYNHFNLSGSLGASGNVMSLLSRDLTLRSLAGKERCFYYLFEGCSELTKAPELPATTLEASCYHSMFYNCTSLTSAPALPATTLASSCYYAMFRGCTSLTTAPALPATTLANYCYSSMFLYCTSLATAPNLPAVTLMDTCYTSMFEGCTSLNSVTTSQTSFSGCERWLTGVAATGTFHRTLALDVTTRGSHTVPSGWTVEPSVEYSTPLTFTANQAGSTVAMENHTEDEEVVTVTLEYSVDGGSTWSPFVVGETTVTLANVGDTVSVRAGAAGNETISHVTNHEAVYQEFDLSYSLNCFSITGSVAVSGNVHSLLSRNFGEIVSIGQGCFAELFWGSPITTAPVLPATTVGEFAYYGMFVVCESLTQAPEIMAETIGEMACCGMFAECASLTAAPLLRASEPALYSYRSMFSGCTSLNSVMTRQTSFGYSCMGWLEDVSESGTFKCRSDLEIPTTRDGSSVPQGWTIDPTLT